MASTLPMLPSRQSTYTGGPWYTLFLSGTSRPVIGGLISPANRSLGAEGRDTVGLTSVDSRLSHTTIFGKSRVPSSWYLDKATTSSTSPFCVARQSIFSSLKNSARLPSKRSLNVVVRVDIDSAGCRNEIRSELRWALCYKSTKVILIDPR